MIQTIFLLSVLISVPLIQRSCVKGMSSAVTSFLTPNPLITSSLKYSLATNTDIGSLLMSSSKSGSQPTIVAIPLYIRNNNLSRYPSIFDVLSTESLAQNYPRMRKTSDTLSHGSESMDSLKKSVNDNIRNDLSSNNTQRYRNQIRKSMKYNIKEEQKVPQRDQNKYDNEFKDSTEPSNYPKTQWSSPLVNQNRYSQLNDRTLSRVHQKYSTDDERKQSSPEFEANSYSTDKFSNSQNNEQKTDHNYSSDDTIKTNEMTFIRNIPQNYSPFSASNEGKTIYRNRITEKSSYNSPQTYNSENSEENSNYRYPDSSHKDLREDNYSKNDNRNQNQNNNEYELNNKNNDIQYRSPPIHMIRSMDRSFQSSQYTVPFQTYISKTNTLRQSYTTPKPLVSHSMTTPSEESSHSISNYETNFQPMASPYVYSTPTLPPNNGPEFQTNGYENPSVYSPETHSVNNNYMRTESKSQSNSNPNYSSDYSTEDIDCYDDNSNDYKSTHSLQSFKSQNIRTESDTKSNDNEEVDTEDIDPSKFDLKIVHLPVSLLRRLISTGDIALPTYQ